MPELSENVKKFLEEPNLGHFVTLMKDGSPQITPLWVDHDGTHVLINTAEGRQKPLNMRRDPRVAISVVDRNDAYRTLAVRGRVVEITEEGAWDHICSLSEKYMGTRQYRGSPEGRIIVKVLPEKIQARGLD